MNIEQRLHQTDSLTIDVFFHDYVVNSDTPYQPHLSE